MKARFYRRSPGHWIYEAHSNYGGVTLAFISFDEAWRFFNRGGALRSAQFW